MPPTTLIKRRADMERKPLEKCHDGLGALDWTNVLAGSDLPQRRLRFVHDNRLAPGVSIGVHAHTDDEEYYLILSGTGRMTLDGRAHDVGPGDITAVFPGGSHGLENTGTTDMHLIVFSVAR